MEGNNDDNIFQKQAQFIAKTTPKLGKPPTRLQKKAPASLQITSYGYGSSTTNLLVPSKEASPHAPIPLLSPLIISPTTSPQQAEEFRFPVISGDLDNGTQDKESAYALPAGGWQHPAVAGSYMEPSSLFTFFESKCVLVNHAK